MKNVEKKLNYILSFLIYRVLALVFLLPSLFGVLDFIGLKLEFIKLMFSSLEDSVFWSGHRLYNRLGTDNSGVASSPSNLPIYISLMAIAAAILLSKNLSKE